jgi:hypothetical protein
VETALHSTDAVAPLSRWLAAKEKSKHDDLDKFVGVLERKEAPPAAMGAIFEPVAYLSVAKSICRAVPEIARFEGKAHTRLREDFKELDRKIIAATGRDCARQIDSAKEVPEGNRGVVVSELTEMNLLRREINKQKRHIPIRQLVTRAGRALQALKPCFMMGPLSVAQYLAQGTLKFDLVIMDKASQLRPEDAWARSHAAANSSWSATRNSFPRPISSTRWRTAPTTRTRIRRPSSTGWRASSTPASRSSRRYRAYAGITVPSTSR